MRTQNNSSQNSSYGPSGDGAEMACRSSIRPSDICWSRARPAEYVLPRSVKQIGRWPLSCGPIIRARRFESQIRLSQKIRTSAIGPRRSRNTSLEFADADAADGYSRDSISVCGVGPAPYDSARRDPLLFRNRPTDRTAARNPRVGTANGANPVSIVIPCHRAIRASGHLGGYRWGLDRKRKLLEMESRKCEHPNLDPLPRGKRNDRGHGTFTEKRTGVSL